MERGGRGQQLIGVCAVLAAAAALSTAAAAPAERGLLIRIERPAHGESGLLRVGGNEGGMDRQAAQQLRVLMRDRTTGRSVTPTADLVRLLGALTEAFPGRTMSIVHGYADPQNGTRSASHREGRALDLRMSNAPTSSVSSQSVLDFSHGWGASRMQRSST